MSDLPSCSKLCIFNHISHSNAIRFYLACLHAEQVKIRLGSFPPYVHIVSFMKGRPSCFVFVFYFVFFYFSPFCFCRSIFFVFHCVTLHPHHILMSDTIRNFFQSLQTKQVGVGWILYYFFRCFGPYGDDQVLVVLLLYISPFIPFSFL